jgi:hypothetical protein
MKYILIPFLLLVKIIGFSQPNREYKTFHEFEPKVVERTVERSPARDRSGEGGRNRHDPSEYRKEIAPTERTLPQSIVPLGYPDGASPSHKSSLQALRNLLMSISGIQGLLVGNPLLDLVTGNPKELAGTIGLKIYSKDYPALAPAFNQLNEIKQQEIAKLATNTKWELDREYRDAGDNYQKKETVKQEIKFWERLEYLVMNSVSAGDNKLTKFTTAFTRSSPLRTDLSFGQVQLGNQPIFNAFIVRPGEINLKYAAHKEVRFHVMIEYSQDSTFGQADNVFGDASISTSFEEVFFVECDADDFRINSNNIIYIPYNSFAFAQGKTYYIKVKIKCYINDVRQTSSLLAIYNFNTASKAIRIHRYGSNKETIAFDKEMGMPNNGYSSKYHF